MSPLSVLSIFAVLFCISGPALTSADCVNECNRNGDCVIDECVCNGNWKGYDCSLYDQYLNSGEVAQMFVGATQWRYFRHAVGFGVESTVSLKWWVNQSNTEEDCDLYLFKDDYPTLANYSYRNITTNQNSTLLQEEASSGTYYAGVFGYTACSFSISVTEVAGCPNGCGDHGFCQSGACLCNPGYTGDQCQFKYNPLEIGEIMNGRVSAFEWSYFYTYAHRGNHFTWAVDQVDDEAADCDMYLAFDRLPTIWNWDFSNVTLEDISIIDIATTLEGRYVLGVYGFSECAFTVTVSDAASNTDVGCPSQCSLHGSCNALKECECISGYQGDDCEWREAPLVLSTPQAGYVWQNAWNYYNIRVITQNALMITLSQTGTAGDCDLYVRGDDKPTHFDFDYIDLGTEEEVRLPIRSPGDATWYIGVFGWEPCTYSLTITEEVVCDCGFDNPHGECAPNGVDCICATGWSGFDCSVALAVLESGVVVESQSVLKYNWKYYQFQVTNSSTGVVSVRENSSVGLVWVYVSFTGEPTLSEYDLSDKTSNSAYHEIAISVPNAQTRTLYIGVYGNPYGIHDDIPLAFDIVGWAAPF